MTRGAFMDPSLQRVVLLPLAALVPIVAYASARADVLIAVAAVNVLLIYLSLRIATGGGLGLGDDGTSGDGASEDAPNA